MTSLLRYTVLLKMQLQLVLSGLRNVSSKFYKISLVRTKITLKIISLCFFEVTMYIIHVRFLTVARNIKHFQVWQAGDLSFFVQCACSLSTLCRHNQFVYDHDDDDWSVVTCCCTLCHAFARCFY